MQSHVRDLDALRQLRDGLLALSTGIDNATQDLRGSTHRADHWIRVEMPAYWKRQTHLAERELNAALDYLQQRQGSTRADDRQAATEAKQRVTRAEQRVEVCQQKQQACRRTLVKLETALQALAGPLAEMNEYVETGLPLARTELKQMIEVLAAYNPSSSAGPRRSADDASAETS